MIESFTIVSGIIALLVLAREPRHSKTVFWAFTCLLILFDGLRWEMGSDWRTYHEHFTGVQIHRTFEPGFALYTASIQSVTDSYSVYLFITTAFIYSGIFYTVFVMTRHSFLALFYLTGTIPWYSGSLRNMMACVFFTLGLKAVMERRLWRFLLLMASGLMFHTTILPLFPIYWLFGIGWGAFAVVFILAATVAFYSRGLITILDLFLSLYSDRSFADRFQGGELAMSSPLLGFARKVVTAAGFIAFAYAAPTTRDLDHRERAKIRFTLMLSLFSIILYYIGTYSISYVSSRVDLYVGIIATSVLIGLLDRSFKSKTNRLVLWAFVTMLVGIFYSRLLSGGPLDLYHPYSSIFYNSDLGRSLY